jgi:alpha-1,3-mannosyltransferase
MLIVHVARQYFPAVGGMEGVVEELAKRQVAAGHEVKVVTLNRLFGTSQIIMPSREIVEGVEVVRLPFIGSQRYPIVRGLLRHLRFADVVHVHGIDFFFDFLALTKFWHRKPLVATTHGGFFHTDFASRAKRIWFQTITRMTSRAYSSIVACSAADEVMFREIEPPSLTLIENGVDTGKFRALASPDAPSMIYFGRLAPNKGLDRLLLWFAEVHRQAPEWTLTIAGRPSGVLPAALRARATELGVGRAVKVVASPDNEQLAELIAGASVYACASTYEGFGLAAIEATSAGLFPVLSRLPPFERTLAALDTGYLTDFTPTAADAERFLTAWARRSNENRRASMERADADYGWGRAAAQYAEVYHGLRPGIRRIGDVNVAAINRSDAFARIDGHLERHAPLMVAFCNAHTVNTARSNPAFARAMGSALVLNDGIGVDLASRLLFHEPFRENLNGTDLTPALLENVSRPLRIFLIGGAPGVAEQAGQALQQRFPHHSIVGTMHGYFSSDETPHILDGIAETKPDLVLVGMGHPIQELWAAENVQRLSAVVMCIGAFLDYAAGAVRRAPEWVRRMRMEWAFRLINNPRRFAGRYLVGNFSFLFHVALQSLLGSGAAPSGRALAGGHGRPTRHTG